MNKQVLGLVLLTLFVSIAIIGVFFREHVRPADQSVISNLPATFSIHANIDESAASPIHFTTVPARESGLSFEYYGNPSDEHYMTEQNGGGVALFDADGDGRLDIFLANGSHFRRPAESVGASHRLFRQIDDWQFQDITVSAGLQSYGFGQGCAAGDYDNDGFCDLFVAHYGGSRLWHNNGDGTFADATHDSGLGNDQWASSAAFADLDDDGYPELYVASYVNWTPESVSSKRIPSPMDFAGLPDLLYKNSADGRFQQVGTEAGISIAGEGKGLAVAICDLDGDHLPDIYVANDTTRNFLFRNLGGLRFEECGILRGVAVSQNGSIGSSMGITIADYNRDGWQDLFVTNFAEEPLDAFTAIGDSAYVANNAELGIDRSSKRMLKFGIVLPDFDLDGWPDLFFANGHLWDDTHAGGEYRMHPSLMRNSGGTRFLDVLRSAGDYFQKKWLGRAVAWGDLDDDGDADLIVSHLLDPPALLRNDSKRAGNVLRLKLIGVRAARQALGTRVEAVVDGRTFVEHVPSGESFQASHDDRVLISLGDATIINELRVYWSSQQVETWNNLAASGLVRLVQGKSTANTAPARLP